MKLLLDPKMVRVTGILIALANWEDATLVSSDANIASNTVKLIQ